MLLKHKQLLQPSTAKRAYLGLLTAPLLIAGLCFTATPSHAAGPSKKEASVEPLTLNFVNAEIESVARTLATLLRHNLVVDPRVKGTINLSTETPVTPAQAWQQFLAVIRLQGFAVVESQGLFKILPEADAKLQGGSVQQMNRAGARVGSTGPESNDANLGNGGGQVVTQIFRLNHEQANNLLPVLRPLISPNNTINVNPGNNSLVITDYADNLQRLGRIIAALDVANASDIEVIVLKHFLELSYEEIGQVLRLPEKTVKSRLFTARQLLKDALQTSGIL